MKKIITAITASIVSTTPALAHRIGEVHDHGEGSAFPALVIEKAMFAFFQSFVISAIAIASIILILLWVRDRNRDGQR
jgi:hypothetical protein